VDQAVADDAGADDDAARRSGDLCHGNSLLRIVQLSASYGTTRSLPPRSRSVKVPIRSPPALSRQLPGLVEAGRHQVADGVVVVARGGGQRIEHAEPVLRVRFWLSLSFAATPSTRIVNAWSSGSSSVVRSRAHASTRHRWSVSSVRAHSWSAVHLVELGFDVVRVDVHRRSVRSVCFEAGATSSSVGRRSAA
jgi:hypothetical protein